MTLRLSRRAQGVRPSPTLAIDAEAKRMKAEGQDIIGFGAGEPDFPTPKHIRERGCRAIEEGYTRYTATAGIMDLRKAIARKMEQDSGLVYQPNEVVVSCGAKHSLYNLFQAVLDPGDEAIIFAPYWVSYVEQIRLAGGEPVIVQAHEEAGFIPDPADLAAAITSRTRVIVVNSPNNPTGAVYPQRVLRQILALAEKYDLLLVADEIYERLAYDEQCQPSLASLTPTARNRVVVINGVSKTYAMTGWRIGYAVGPRSIIKAMEDIQSHSTSNPAAMAQVASIAALDGDQTPVEEMRREFIRRRDRMMQLLGGIPGVRCVCPSGAFYTFPNVSDLFGKTSPAGTRITGSTAFAAALLAEEKVALVPGAAFGSDEHIRLSYATSMENIEEGLRRLRRFAEGLK